MPAYPIILRDTPGGERRSAPLDIDVALTTPFPFDAHTVQYEGEMRRNKADVSPDNPLILSIELYDFDKKDAEPGWADVCLSRLPPGFVGYRTAGGFRALTLRETPFVVRDAETWEDWRAYHGGRAEALGAIVGAQPDHATDEPNRLFRLPHVVRADGKPSFPAIVGDLGYATLAPAPWERRAATEQAEGGRAATSLVGAAFVAAGRVIGEQGSKLIVDCPWSHEHTTPGGTFVDDTPDHYGHFVCGHSHCKAAGRGSPQALEALGSLPAVAAELARWPDPGLGVWTRVESTAPAPPPTAPAVKGWKEILGTPVPPIVWINEGLRLAPGRPSFIVSAPNVGKSWSIQTMAVELAAGLPVFGQFEGPAVPVMFVTQDSCHVATAERFQLLHRSLAVSQDIPLFWYTPRVKMVKRAGRDVAFDPTGLIEVERAASARGCKVVILDSLFALLEGMDPNSTDIGAAVRATNDPDVAWIWTHHTARAGEAYYGSQAIAGAMGTQWLVTLAKEGQVDGPRLWTCKKRPERISGGTPAPFRTEWKDCNRVAWIPDDEPMQGERPEDRMQRAILFVMANKGLSGKDKILECVRGKKETKRLVWEDLLVRGIIEHVASRYLVAAGVSVPQEQPEGVRDEE